MISNQRVDSESEELSPEELQERRGELIEFYDQEIEVLEKKKRYEKLLTDIQGYQIQRKISQVKMAQMLAPPPEEPDKSEKDGTSEPSEQDS